MTIVVVHLLLDWVAWTDELLVESARAVAVVVAILVHFAQVLLGLFLDHVTGLVLRAEVILLVLVQHLLMLFFSVLLVFDLTFIWDLFFVQVLAVAQFEEFKSLSVLVTDVVDSS